MNAPFSTYSAPARSRRTDWRSPRQGLAPTGATWIAILSRRSTRLPLIVAAGLSMMLFAALFWWLAFERASEEPVPELSELAQLDRLQASPAAHHGAAEPPPLVGEPAIQQNAAARFASLGPAAKPFRFAGGLQDLARARACLAAAMFFEAGDDAIGQLAVGQVVLNRVRHPAFPAAVCGVVAQGSERATGCQFTFTCDGALARPVPAAARARALAHADLMLNGLVFAGVGLATHYHTEAVYPWWSPKLEKIARVGTHLFFRWPGHWGSAGAMLAKRALGEPSAALFAGFGGDDAIARIQAADDRGTAQAAANAGAARLLAGEERAWPAILSGTAAVIPLARRLDMTPADALATPIIAAGALAGNRLLRMFPAEGVFFLQVAGGSSDSARRRVAEMLCGGRSACRVYGWDNAADAPRVSELDANARRTLAFTYVRQASDSRRASPSAVGLM